MIDQINFEDSSYIVIDTKMATVLGIEKAVILKKIFNWLKHNKKMHAFRKDFPAFKDGQIWVFNSYTGWENDIKFLKRDRIRRHLNSLITDGYIKTANYNKYKFDKTIWYTIIWPKFFNDFPHLGNLDDANINNGQNNQYDNNDFTGGVAKCDIDVAKCDIDVAKCDIDVANRHRQAQNPLPDYVSECDTDVAKCDTRVAKCDTRVAKCYDDTNKHKINNINKINNNIIYDSSHKFYLVFNELNKHPLCKQTFDTAKFSEYLDDISAKLDFDVKELTNLAHEWQEYHLDRGTKIKSIKGSFRTWCKNAFGRRNEQAYKNQTKYKPNQNNHNNHNNHRRFGAFEEESYKHASAAFKAMQEKRKKIEREEREEKQKLEMAQ